MEEYTDKEFCLEVSGSNACFTRPELKVERVSYDVITPSAARAIFEAILWKPAIRWQITKIEVLNPIKWESVRRNEVGAVGSLNQKGSIFIEDNRQQRASLLLKDVRYRIHAKLIYIPVNKRNIQSREAGKDENPMKYYEMFERRAEKGQCFNQPYLGTREFSAMFRLVKTNEPNSKEPSPIDETRDLGIMLYDMDFTDSKKTEAMFYRVQMNKGIIIVPELNSKDILR